MSLDLNVLYGLQRPGPRLGMVSFSFYLFFLFLKKAPKLYGFKEAPEKHKFISVHVVKQELSSRDHSLALPWRPPLCCPRLGVKAILSRGSSTQRHRSRPPWLHGAQSSPCMVTIPRSTPALVQHCGSARASPGGQGLMASPCNTHALGLPHSRKLPLDRGDKLDFMS